MTGQPSPLPEEAVTRALRGLSEHYPTVPDTVTDRLDRALAELPDLSPPPVAAPEPAPRPPWWRRHVLALSSAVAAIALFAVGVNMLNAPGGSDPLTATDGAEEDFAESSEDESGYTVTHSGRDYGVDGLDEVTTRQDSGLTTQDDERAAPLSTDPEQLDSCVGMIEDTYDGAVSTVDFGFYNGEPAMVVVLDAADGTVYAIAVGVDCGVTGTDLIADDEVPAG